MDKESDIGFGVKSIEFDLSFSIPGQLLDAVMGSGIVRLLGGFACVMLAFMFGVMFIIGSVGILNGKRAEQNVIAVENQNEMTIDAINENTE